MTFIFITIFLRTLAGVFAKQAGLTSAGRGFVQGVVLNPWYLSELTVLCGQAVVWSLVLRRYKLSTVYPYLSVVFGFSLLSAWLIFRETILTKHLIGIGLIMLGRIIAAGNTDV
jgi:uncharacterized membrane protein